MVLGLLRNLYESPHIDFGFALKNGIRARILERPGIWMTDAELSGLVDDLRTVVGKLDKGDLEYGVLSGSREALNRSVLTVIYDRASGRPVAFNALALMDCTLHGKPVSVLHLGLIVVEPGYRAQGFSWILYGLTTFLLFFKNRLKPFWMSSVTQVPAIVGMVAESFSRVYPSGSGGTRRSFSHVALAREIMARHRHVFGVGADATFNEEKFIIENSYTGGSDNLKKTFDEATKHRRPFFNELCRRELDYGRGDDYLQLGVIDLRSFWFYVSKKAVSGSLAAVFGQMVYVLLESWILPVLQWFSASNQMGELRPWKTR